MKELANDTRDIARELAHQLGGDIFVQSEYGQGSSFSLVLDI